MESHATLQLDYSYLLKQLVADFDAALADMFQVVSAVGSGTYVTNASSMTIGIRTVIVQDTAGLENFALDRAARACFLTAIGKFISYLDKLIAVISIHREGIILDRDFDTEEEVIAFFWETLHQRILQVARDRGLSNPKKIRFFDKLSPGSTEFAMKMFKLRQILEHHQSVSDAHLDVQLFRVAMLIDDVEVDSLPRLIRKGQRMQMSIVADSKRFEGGSLAIKPEDVEALIFNLRLVASEIFGTCFVAEPNPDEPMNLKAR